MTFINWNLAKQPMNWLTIIFMLLLGAMAGHLVLSYMGIEPATAATAGNGTGSTAADGTADKGENFRNSNQ